MKGNIVYLITLTHRITNEFCDISMWSMYVPHQVKPLITVLLSDHCKNKQHYIILYFLLANTPELYNMVSRAQLGKRLLSIIFI